MDRNKKLAMAMAAVSAYIKAEEEENARYPAQTTQNWSRSGRLAISQQREMVQQRNLAKISNFR